MGPGSTSMNYMIGTTGRDSSRHSIHHASADRNGRRSLHHDGRRVKPLVAIITEFRITQPLRIFNGHYVGLVHYRGYATAVFQYLHPFICLGLDYIMDFV